jgi:hypothetical protein
MVKNPPDVNAPPRGFRWCQFVTKQDLAKAKKEIMIAQATLDASLAGLTTAVNNAVAAMAAGSPVTSTPDTAVAAYQAGVDAQTVALAAGTPPAATPPLAS